jgi:hypothetical protein
MKEERKEVTGGFIGVCSEPKLVKLQIRCRVRGLKYRQGCISWYDTAERPGKTSQEIKEF